MRLSPNGRYLYVGGQYSDLSWKIVDLANASSPVLVSSNYVGAAVLGFDFSGSTVFLATGTGVQVYDGSNPAQPRLLRSYSTPAPAQDIRVSGNNLLAADARGGLSILALSDLDAPEVFITGPTSSPIWTNGTETVDLAGTADDSLGLVQGTVGGVTWVNNQGGGGSATGTTSWSVTNIVLVPGTNVLTVNAIDGAGNSSNATLTVIYQTPSQSQVITMSAVPDHTFGDAPIPLVAAASSGLPVAFGVVSGPASISNNVLTVTGAGTVTVQATQAGNGAFTAAVPVIVSFNVAKADQAIAFAPVPPKSGSDAPFALSASSSSGLPVYFDMLSGPATLSSNVVSLLAAGMVSVSAWQPGSSNYNPAVPVQQTFVVGKVPQTVTFGPLSQQRAGDPPFQLSASASSGLPVSFSVLSGLGVLSGSILTLTGWGTVTVDAAQAGNNTYAPAPDVVQSFFVVPSGSALVAKGRQMDGSFLMAFYGTVGSNYQLQASMALTNWVPLFTFPCTNSPTAVLDTTATNFSWRFYRTLGQ